MLAVFPDSVGGHVGAGGEWLTPVGRGGGFPPVVGDFGALAIPQFSHADVAVEPSVAIVAGPFDDDDVVVQVQASADFQG